ncbi:hypothetical protein PRZ48_007029 [Zasmidium cellare]|uniref:Peptidase A1 domain-containing protein n=1 Tax=Zasmidium cellare TaxID=395010 RepID=A0ABR0EIG5_ZASCE|nr:hypothetical protein PRZ48_007029 [Zasmidium cellare]
MAKVLPIAVLALLRPIMAQGQCDIEPMALEWTNTTVTADGLGVTRGIAIGIGTPTQIFALRPYTALNNTRVNNVANCGTTSNDTCIGGLGGIFDKDLSSSYSVSVKTNWNGSQVDTEETDGAYLYFNDRITFERRASVDGFPLVLDSTPYGGDYTGLPLGSNSSFTAAAVKSGVAPSEVLGLWTGSRSLDPADGLLVVGGYDESRVNGVFVHFPVSDSSTELPCPLQINVTSISYSDQRLMNETSRVRFCIEPYNQRFVLPPAVTAAFANATGQNSTLFPGDLHYSADSRPSGDLIVILDNGYSTTIPNFDVFTPLRGSDEYGRYSITNDTVVEAGLRDTRSDDPDSVIPALGGLFLTFNYLLIDYDNGTFSLAPAISANVSTSPALRTVCTPSPVPEPSEDTTRHRSRHA